MNLRTRFLNLCQSYGISKHWAAEEFDLIEYNYSKLHKKYHNLTHLEELFKLFDTHKSELNQSNEVAFAIFYHDIIYKIGPSNNEEKSAEMAQRSLLKIDFNPKSIQNIVELILCTKHHSAKSEDEKWMIDFDLSILGQASEIYQSYAQKIRGEYKQIPSLIYNPGRKKVLKHFLGKDFIFQTDIFREKYEDNAIINLESELNSL